MSVFLGGDIIKNEFINSFKYCFNFHSGISPFFNGNKTNFNACANFRPNFVGGTLMRMSEKIDGGDILMHYLPEINYNDNPGSLFVKGIIGAVEMYTYLLSDINNHKKNQRN